MPDPVTLSRQIKLYIGGMTNRPDALDAPWLTDQDFNVYLGLKPELITRDPNLAALVDAANIISMGARLLVVRKPSLVVKETRRTITAK